MFNRRSQEIAAHAEHGVRSNRWQPVARVRAGLELGRNALKSGLFREAYTWEQPIAA